MSIPWNLQRTESEVIGIDARTSTQRSLEYDVPTDDVLPHFKNLHDKARASVGQIHSVRAPINWLNPGMSPPSVQGEGSCFVINFRDTKVLITNDHCVRDSAPGGISVSFPATGAKKFPLRWIASSPERDMAIFRMASKDANAIDLVPLEIGDSDKLQSGNWLASLGFPLGQPHIKMSKGVFSGIEWVQGEWRGQVDYALNHGNSGGPCINGEGHVVGINNAIIESAQNIGYTILSNDLKRFLSDFEYVWDRASDQEKRGTIHVPKSFISMKIEPMDPALMRYLNSDVRNGMYVAAVSENTMFSDQIKQDDQIVSINGHDVDEYGQVTVQWTSELMSLNQALDRVAFGDTIDFGLIRKGSRIDAQVTFTPSDPRNIGPKYTPFDMPHGVVFAGMIMQSLNLNHVQLLAQTNPELMRYASVVDQCGQSRIVITGMMPNTVAATKPIRPGMIVKSFNDHPVTDMDSMVALAESAKQRQYTIIAMEDMTRVVFDTNADLPRAAMAAAEMTMNNPLIDVLRPIKFSRINCEHVVGYCNCADRGERALKQLGKMFSSASSSSSSSSKASSATSPAIMPPGYRGEMDAFKIAQAVFPTIGSAKPAMVTLEDANEIDEIDMKTLKDLLPSDMLEEMMLMGDLTLN